jgi:hypothetical protein
MRPLDRAVIAAIVLLGACGRGSETADVGPAPDTSPASVDATGKPPASDVTAGDANASDLTRDASTTNDARAAADASPKRTDDGAIDGAIDARIGTARVVQLEPYEDPLWTAADRQGGLFATPRLEPDRDPRPGTPPSNAPSQPALVVGWWDDDLVVIARGERLLDEHRPLRTKDDCVSRPTLTAVSAPELRPSGAVTAPELRPSGAVTAPELRPSGAVTAPELRPSGAVTAPERDTADTTLTLTFARPRCADVVIEVPLPAPDATRLVPARSPVTAPILGMFGMPAVTRDGMHLAVLLTSEAAASGAVAAALALIRADDGSTLLEAPLIALRDVTRDAEIDPRSTPPLDRFERLARALRGRFTPARALLERAELRPLDTLPPTTGGFGNALVTVRRAPVHRRPRGPSDHRRPRAPRPPRLCPGCEALRPERMSRHPNGPRRLVRPRARDPPPLARRRGLPSRGPPDLEARLPAAPRLARGPAGASALRWT